MSTPAWLKLKEDQSSAVVELSLPFLAGDEYVTTLELRTPTVGDVSLNFTAVDAAERELRLFCRLLKPSLSRSDIALLPLRDYHRLQVAYTALVEEPKEKFNASPSLAVACGDPFAAAYSIFWSGSAAQFGWLAADANGEVYAFTSKPYFETESETWRMAGGDNRVMRVGNVREVLDKYNVLASSSLRRNWGRVDG